MLKEINKRSECFAKQATKNRESICWKDRNKSVNTLNIYNELI